MSPAFLNGQPATAADLRALALTNYGHFTSMLVRNRAVRGLGLHLRRLREATRELFGIELGDARVLDAMRATLDAVGDDCSLRVTVFSRRFDYRKPNEAVPADVLTSTSPPAPESASPIRTKSFEFVRPLPHVKHVGTFPLFQYRRQALAAGFDDALFVDGGGTVVEGSVWNAGFWDGRGVVWPQGPALRGTMERLLQLGLDEIGVPQRTGPVRLDEAAGFAGAFAVNAAGIRLICGIDGTAVPHSPELSGPLARALETRAWEPL